MFFYKLIYIFAQFFFSNILWILQPYVKYRIIDCIYNEQMVRCLLLSGLIRSRQRPNITWSDI